MSIYHNQTEIWKLIPHLPGYEASNTGRIRNRKTGTIRKLQITSAYYHAVSIGGRTYLVHRLVMAAFAGRNLDRSELVRHRDDDGLNNQLANLSIGTQMDNWHDRRMNDRAGWKLRQRDVHRIRADLRRRNWHDIARQHGISTSHVRNIASGHRYGWLR